MLYFCTEVLIVKDGIVLLQDAIKYAPNGKREVELTGGSGEAIRTVGIRITFRLVVSLNATPERIKAASEIVIPSDVILGANGFSYLDGATVCAVIVENWGRTIT